MKTTGTLLPESYRILQLDAPDIPCDVCASHRARDEFRNRLAAIAAGLTRYEVTPPRCHAGKMKEY